MTAGDSARPRRFLIFLLHAGYIRHYGRVLALLAERGHEVHLAFSRFEKDAGDAALAESLAAAVPRITYGPAPERARTDGWRPLAALVRSLIDIARYMHPNYAGADALRARVARKFQDHAESAVRVDPVTSRLTVRVVAWMTARTNGPLSFRLIRLLGALERAIPTSRPIDDYLRERDPDAVVVTPVIDFGSSQVEYVKSARALGIPSAVAVASWDNLTGKGLIRVAPDRVFVWNETQVAEAVEMHLIERETIVVTGAQKFDEWFERAPTDTAEELAARAGLTPGEPFLLYVCSSPFIAPDEVAFVRDWLSGLRARPASPLASIGVLVRPHPQNAAQWAGVDLSGFGNVAIWPREGAQPDAGSARAGFFDSLHHSSAVVGINTSALIEASILGKSVLTVLTPRFAGTQENTLHFNYLLRENGGFLHVARSFAEHADQLEALLEAGDAETARTLRFVESFVRPFGLDRPAAPLVVAGLEELASSTAGRETKGVGTALVRAALLPLAAVARAVGAMSSRVRT